MNRLANSLQTDVMSLRLVKINTVFERLPRIVRDLSFRSGKEIELSLSGGETEIDRKTIEQLIDPLIHLIRNSVDHGIEPPAERVRKGKPGSGSVTVRSHQEGNHAVIEVIDDGKGLDIDKIRQEALKRKIFTEDALVSVTDEEIANLIFMPGFTTRPEATKISGRGVGLDIVKNNIRMIGGTITLSGSQNTGTRVRLRIPVSMAVTDVLLTEVAGRQYAFPFSSILKTVKVKRRDIHGPRKGEFILFDGTVLGVRYLGELLGITQKESLRQRDSDEEISVIVVPVQNQNLGIVVDDILKRESMLIKPLEKYLAGIKEFSGATLSGDGSVVLVIDPMGLKLET